MSVKKKCKVMVLGIALSVLLFANNTCQCMAMDKITVGKYDLDGVKANVELGVKGNRFWISGNATDYCDFSVKGEYIGEDGDFGIGYSASQRDYFSYARTLAYDIISIYADITVVANNGEYAEDHLALY
ncbi:MAG: hypothetical protein NC092_05050 [Butyrivibrio sp.]|nr:hypothetical protein [Muribaculum sp.]MCM1552041.1 hypothetical protein [Butyrivibrio sp.]